MQIDGVDIWQFVALAPLVWAIINIWSANRRREQKLIDMALWKKDVEHSLELLKTQGCKDTTGITAELKEFRKEVRNDHKETESKIEEMENRLEQKIDLVAKEDREGRAKIYDLIESIRKK